LGTTSGTKYTSKGLIAGLGGTIKAGPGAIALGFSYGNAVNGVDATTEKETNKNDILADARYTWNVHSKFSIAPRWRFYLTTYDEKSGHVKSKMENRPEVILTGSF